MASTGPLSKWRRFLLRIGSPNDLESSNPELNAAEPPELLEASDFWKPPEGLDKWLLSNFGKRRPRTPAEPPSNVAILNASWEPFFAAELFVVDDGFGLGEMTRNLRNEVVGVSAVLGRMSEAETGLPTKLLIYVPSGKRTFIVEFARLGNSYTSEFSWIFNFRSTAFFPCVYEAELIFQYWGLQFQTSLFLDVVLGSGVKAMYPTLEHLCSALGHDVGSLVNRITTGKSNLATEIRTAYFRMGLQLALWGTIASEFDGDSQALVRKCRDRLCRLKSGGRKRRREK